MRTTASNPFAQASYQVYGEVKRKDLGSCPLGTVGNLQFSAAQGGTARATVPGVGLSILRRAGSDMLGIVVDVLTLPDSHDDSWMERVDAGEQRHYLSHARLYSRSIGNLLGYLTAGPRHVEAQRRAADELIYLGLVSRGDLNNLWEGMYCLLNYTDELKDSDVRALVTGALRRPDGVVRELDQMPPGDGRSQALEVLEQVDAAIERRRTRGLAEDGLGQIAGLLSTYSIDKLRLKRSLISVAEYLETSRKVSTKLDEGRYLDILLRSLPKERLQALQPLARQEKLNKCLQALGTSTLDGITRSRKALNLLHQSLAALQEKEPVRQAA